MRKKFYEVVVEGHFDYINGMLEGFILGKRKNWKYYFSKKADIKTETLTEIIAEWITFKTKIHHLIIEEKFYKEFTSAIKEFKDHPKISKRFIKSAKVIKGASFKFEFKTYGRKYGNEIKALLNNIPKGIELHNYNPYEKVSEGGKGIERYAPEHEYTFEGNGKITGELDLLISFKMKMTKNPLIEVDHILLTF